MIGLEAEKAGTIRYGDGGRGSTSQASVPDFY